MNDVFPETFYSATARPAPERRALAQDIETEICVVGGGFAGLWTARALLARGQEVVLLESGEVAGRASGQNGGFVSAGYAERLAKIVERVGIDQARELYALSRDGVEIVRSILAEGEFGLDPVPGRLNVLRYDDEIGLRDEAEMLARDFDHDVVVWPRERVREALATERYYQALHEADAFHLHPLNLARMLAADIEARGGTIYERSRVTAADLEGLRKSVWTEKGRVRAFQVVLAGSAFLGEAFPALAATVRPVRTHVVVTAPLGDRGAGRPWGVFYSVWPGVGWRRRGPRGDAGGLLVDAIQGLDGRDADQARRAGASRYRRGSRTGSCRSRGPAGKAEIRGKRY